MTNDMTPERWQQIEEVLQTVINRAPDERKALLTQYCGGDDELRREIESLLVYETADAFIQEPIKGAAQALSDELRDDLIGQPSWRLPYNATDRTRRDGRSL